MDEMRDYLVCLGAYPETVEAAMDKAAALGMSLEELLGMVLESLAAGDLDCYLEQISPGNSYLAWEDRCTGQGAMEAIEDKIMELDREILDVLELAPSQKKGRRLEELEGKMKAWKKEAQDLVDEYGDDLKSQAKDYREVMEEVHRRHADKTALLGEARTTAAAEQRVYRMWNEKHFDFF